MRRSARASLRSGLQLAEVGLGRGSRIGIALPEGAESLVAVLAACSVAACAPLNPDLDADTLFRQFVALRLDAVLVPLGDSSARDAADRAHISVIDVDTSDQGPVGTFLLSGATGRPATDVRPPELDQSRLLC
jgi:non-ribosomal peptide synthetase component F